MYPHLCPVTAVIGSVSSKPIKTWTQYIKSCFYKQKTKAVSLNSKKGFVKFERIWGRQQVWWTIEANRPDWHSETQWDWHFLPVFFSPFSLFPFSSVHRGKRAARTKTIKADPKSREEDEQFINLLVAWLWPKQDRVRTKKGKTIMIKHWIN